jgi:ribosome-binding factor A
MKSESRRQQKMASLLQETLSLILPEELRPFTASLVTVTRVEVQGDLRAARVLLSVFGPASPEDVRTHLTKRTGAIRHRLASLVEFKYNPGLFFVLDPSAEAVERIERIIAETQHDDETG